MDKRKIIALDIGPKIDWQKYTIEEMEFFRMAFNNFYLRENKEKAMLEIANNNLPYEIQNFDQLGILYMRYCKACGWRVKYSKGTYLV